MICITSDENRPVGDIFSIGVVGEVEDWQEVVDYILKEHEATALSRILASFDDYHQACYTSMHASNGEGLHYSPAQDDVDYESSQYYRNEFEHRLAAIRASERLDFSALLGKINLTEEDAKILTVVNANPLAVCDLPLRFSRVPVLESTELFAAFPNGYFSCDFNAFENKALCEYWAEQFGYQLIAIGASFLAFARKEPLTEVKLGEMIAQMTQLYGLKNEQILAPLKVVLKQQNYMFLPYVESLDNYDDVLV